MDYLVLQMETKGTVWKKDIGKVVCPPDLYHGCVLAGHKRLLLASRVCQMFAHNTKQKVTVDKIPPFSSFSALVSEI